MAIMVFDIETVPDFITGAKLLDLSGESPASIAEAMLAKKREKSPEAKLVAYHLQKIVAISVVVRCDEWIKVWSLGEEIDTEAELLSRFFSGIEKYSPILVSWNGKGFDCPVIHYRSLLHGICSNIYWDHGDINQNFKWNNYLNRYHMRHLDLMDYLAGFQASARAPLNEMAIMLGFPGKMGMDGDQVLEFFLDDKLDIIRNYCETDVLNTYLVYLKFQLIRGVINKLQYEKECELLRDSLYKHNKQHLREFLSEWI
jgi:3'-5' exonuclease